MSHLLERLESCSISNSNVCLQLDIEISLKCLSRFVSINLFADQDRVLLFGL